MSEYLVMYMCIDCEEEHYFPIDSLPGGDEHCEYCEHCGGKLVAESGWEETQLRAENARLAAAHEAAADELARVVQELLEAAYLLAKIDADMGMDDDGDLFCYFDSSFARKIEDMAQKYKPE